MYNAQPKLNLDTLLGGILLVGGVAWTVMTMAYIPAPAAPTVANALQQSQMMAAAPGKKASEEVTSFPSDDVEVIVDKKYA